jgi:hypothetical protein
MQRQTLRASAQAALRGSYFLFFFAAFFLADFLAAFFFLATVHPPLKGSPKLRRPAILDGSSTDGLEGETTNQDHEPRTLCVSSSESIKP